MSQLLPELSRVCRGVHKGTFFAVSERVAWKVNVFFSFHAGEDLHGVVERVVLELLDELGADGRSGKDEAEKEEADELDTVLHADNDFFAIPRPQKVRDQDDDRHRKKPKRAIVQEKQHVKASVAHVFVEMSCSECRDRKEDQRNEVQRNDAVTGSTLIDV